ncbi:hypothetical protein FVQ89_11695 [Homoserinibacter sp. GY 40078]|nr:hypothetical protein FVQ89_11695 [Homoserinibacter sp. GY 40078]
MTLVGEVIAVRRVNGGEGVSYGYTYRTASETTLALVGLGYADGVPRLASNRGEAFIGGHRHPLVGRIAMDQFVLDCHDAEVTVGDEVTVFGDTTRGAPSALEWGAWTERSAPALTSGIAERVSREAA